MGCKPELFPALLPSLFQLTNIRGALITMPHKVSVVELLDEVTPTVKVAGACNAVKRSADGRLLGDMFDGEGFVRGLRRKGLTLSGASALVVGAGGVGSAIVASLVAALVAAVVIGVVIARFTERPAWRVAARQLAFTAVPAAPSALNCNCVSAPD
jgi:shikimate dehydrogenase